MAIEYASIGGKSHASRDIAFQSYLRREGISFAEWERRQGLDAASASLVLAYQKLKATYATN
jgi:hypothetical protein